MKKHRITNNVHIIPSEGETIANEEVPIYDGLGVPNRNGIETQSRNMVN